MCPHSQHIFVSPVSFRATLYPAHFLCLDKIQATRISPGGQQAAISQCAGATKEMGTPYPDSESPTHLNPSPFNTNSRMLQQQHSNSAVRGSRAFPDSSNAALLPLELEKFNSSEVFKEQMWLQNISTHSERLKSVLWPASTNKILWHCLYTTTQWDSSLQTLASSFQGTLYVLSWMDAFFRALPLTFVKLEFKVYQWNAKDSFFKISNSL